MRCPSLCKGGSQCDKKGINGIKVITPLAHVQTSLRFKQNLGMPFRDCEQFKRGVARFS
jgi:hypothetical protein